MQLEKQKQIQCRLDLKPCQRFRCFSEFQLNICDICHKSNAQLSTVNVVLNVAQGIFVLKFGWILFLFSLEMYQKLYFASDKLMIKEK